MNEQDKLLSYMLNKNAQELADKIKVEILETLIVTAKNRNGILLLEELEYIKEGVENARAKEKDKEINALKSVINNLIGKFGEIK